MSETLDLNAYYYGFDATGQTDIDRVLEAVALAGSSFHYTENWNEKVGDGTETAASRIQKAANRAAKKFAAAPDMLEALKLLRMLRDETGIVATVPRAQEALDGLDALIAKAEGKS